MNLSFENKVALVTGGSSGMELATAQAFAAEGAAVVLADVNEVAARAATNQFTKACHKAWAYAAGPSITLPSTACSG